MNGGNISLKEIVLFVFDTKENFEKSNEYLGVRLFGKVICVGNANEFDEQILLLNNDELLFMAVHVFSSNINGIRKFVVSGIDKKYPNLDYAYISEGNAIEIQKAMVNAEIMVTKIFKYHEVQGKLEDGSFKAKTKADLMRNNPLEPEVKHGENNIYPHIPRCKYAIITALEEDEMGKVLPFIVKLGKLPNKKHLIEYGHLIDHPDKLIAYASQHSTGMVDASILATELILSFRPDFLIMAGVLGGRPGGVNIGDVVVASKVFTVDKGKIDESGFHPEPEVTQNESAAISSFQRQKKQIIEFIRGNDTTRKSSVDVHFGSIACVRQVIDIEGYFDDEIVSVDRRAIALEMESYGVSRACQLVNDGLTTPLIIKSAMDNTQDKANHAKPYAAWTSAMFIKYILLNDLI